MKPNQRAERAVAYFQEDYLCSQSVLMAYAPQMGIALSDAARIAAPFGEGMSRKGWTCGAVTGAMMVIGLRFGHEVGTDLKTKERMYQKSQAFIAKFEQRNGSVVCRELLGRDLNAPGELEIIREEGLFESHCPNFVRNATEILEQILEIKT